MQNVLKNQVSKIILIGTIKGLTEQIKRTRRKLHKSTENKWRYINIQRKLGVEMRYHLLAYAFLSGKAYASVEAKVNPDHTVSKEQLFHVAQKFHPTKMKNLSQADIQSWLEGESK